MNNSKLSFQGLLGIALCFLFCLPNSSTAQRKNRKKDKEQAHYLTQAKTVEEIESLDNKLEKLYNMYIGHFSNKLQADTSSLPIYSEQEIIGVPLWSERLGEYWFYWTWFVAGNPEAVLGQGVAKVSRLDREQFLIEHFSLSEAMLAERNEWANAKPFAEYSPKDLIPFGCSGLIEESEKNVFELKSPEICKGFQLNSLGDIKGIRFEQRISAEVLQDYRSYYGDDDEELFRYAKPTGLYFKRQDLEKAKYRM